MVDGVERSFNEIPIEDIESFSVLKDASATAIYGQRGANGVVLVTTKQGVVGKVKINAKVLAGLDARGPMPEYAVLLLMPAWQMSPYRQIRISSLYS